MTSEPCRHCAGTGLEAVAGTGTYGAAPAGLCWACSGSGFTRWAPPVAFAAPAPAPEPTPEQIEAMRREEDERDAWMQAHEHHFS